MRTVLILAALIVSVACSAPSGKPSPRLITSPGVQALFDDPEVGEVLASGTVRCRTQYRVGSHLPSRTCMTVEEWQLKARQAKERAEGMTGGACVASRSPNGACGHRANPAL